MPADAPAHDAGGRAGGGAARGALAGLNAHIVRGFSEAELAVVARWLEQVAELEVVPVSSALVPRAGGKPGLNAAVDGRFDALA
jgi:hypothetical protein